MHKKKFIPCEMKIVPFRQDDVFMASTFNANNYDDNPWNDFENWGG